MSEQDCLKCKYSRLKGAMKLYIICDQKPEFRRTLPDDGDDFRNYACDQYEAKE